MEKRRGSIGGSGVERRQLGVRDYCLKLERSPGYKSSTTARRDNLVFLHQD